MEVLRNLCLPGNPKDKYEKKERIGQGSFGRVYKGVDKKSGEIVAIKVIDLAGVEPQDYEVIGQEIQMLKETKERHVLKFYGGYINKKDTKLWLVTEFINGGNAKELAKPTRMEEMFIAIILRGVIEALVYLHEKEKIHRDIKAENILVSSEGEVKLVDFGVSARLVSSEDKRHTVAGTPYWMAPEVITQQGHDYKADIWSIGITAIELATGRVPHDDVSPMKLSVVIATSAPPTLEGKYSADFKHFVSVCLKKNPLERPSAKQLLQHNFIAKAKSTVYLKDLVARFIYWKNNQREEPTDSEKSNNEVSSVNSESDSDDSRRQKSISIHSEDDRDNNNTPLNRSVEKIAASSLRTSGSSIDNEGYNTGAAGNRKVNPLLDYSAEYYEDLEEPEDEERDTSYKKRFSLNDMSLAIKQGKNSPSPNMQRRMNKSAKSKSKKSVRGSKTLTLAEIEEKSNEESSDYRNGASEESSELKRQSSKASNASKRKSLALGLPTTLPTLVIEEETLESTTSRVPFDPVSNPRGPVGMGGSLVKAAGTDVFEYRPNAVGMDNLIDMPKIDLAPILDNLHKRYNNTIPYTYVDNILISVNPEKQTDIYTRLFMRNFRHKVLFQMPPHIFALAESAYMNMMHLNRAQAIVLLGLSGSGKTESLKHIINYYSVLSSPLTRSDTSTLLIESLTVLEAFGNAKTMHNNNGTRFIMNLDLFFETYGGLVGAKLNTYGLQKTRISTSQKNERAFHIFYWLLAYAGANKEERKKYSLKPLEKYNYLRNGCTILEGENAIGEFNKVNNAFSILRIDEGSRAWIYRGLSAVLLLGNVEFKHSNKKGCKISSEGELKTIGELLDVKHSMLMNIICPDKNTFTLQEATSRRDAFARGIYGQIFNHVIELLNDRLARTMTKSMITIFDHYGFEGLEDNNFEQLTVNYFAEKMHQFVNTQVIEVEQALYRGEKIEWANYSSTYDKGPLDLVERILTIIEDESTPKEGGTKPTDESVFESIFSKQYRNPHFSSRPGTTNFQIEHTSGKIKYNADAFLRSNEEPVQFRGMLTQLPKGKNPFFNLDEEQYLLRSAAQVKVTMTNLSSMLLSSQLLFVACIKPGPKKNATLDPIYVRAQIKALQLIDIAKMRSRAFPMHLSPYTFMRLFSPLDRQAIDTKEFLIRNSASGYYRLTKTKLFMRSMEYYRFEAMAHKERDQATLKLQCLLRMQLARAKLMQWIKALTRIQAYIRMKKTQERIFSTLSTKETRRLRKGGGGSNRALSRSETIAADSDLSISTDTDVSPKKRRKSMAPGSLTLDTIASSEESEGSRDKSKSSRRSKPSKQNSMMNVLVTRGGKKFKDGSKKDRSLHAQSMMIELSPREVPQTARPSSSGSLDLGDGVTSRPSVPFVLPAFLAPNATSSPPPANGTGSGSEKATSEKQSSGSDTDGPTLKTRRSARQFTRQPTIGRTPSRPNNELISPEMRDSINASIEAEMKAKAAAANSTENAGKDNTALNGIKPEISVVEPPRKLSMAQEIRPELDKITEVKEPETPKEDPVVVKPEEKPVEKPVAPIVPVVAEPQPVKVEPPKVEEPQPVKPPIVVDVKLPDPPPPRRRSSSEVLKNRPVPKPVELAAKIPEEVVAPVVETKPAEPPKTPEPGEPSEVDGAETVTETPPAARPQLVSKNSVRSRLALFESVISSRAAQQQNEQKSPPQEAPKDSGPATEGRSLNRRKTFSSLSPSAVVTSPTVKSNAITKTEPIKAEPVTPVKEVVKEAPKVDEVKQPTETTNAQPAAQETSTPAVPAVQKDASTPTRPTMTRQGSVQNLKRTTSFTRTEEIFNAEFKKTLEPLLGPLELQFGQLTSAHQRMIQHLNGPSFNPTAFINFLDMLKHVTTQFDHSLTEAIDKSKIALKSKRISGDQNTTPGLAPTANTNTGLVSVKEDEELKGQQTPLSSTTPRSGSNVALITPRSSKARSTELPSASTSPSLNKTNNAYLKSFSPIIVANFHLATFELEKETPNVDSIISKFKYCLTSGLDVFTLPEYLNNKHKLETQQKFREAFPDRFAASESPQKVETSETKEPKAVDPTPVSTPVVAEPPKETRVARTQSTPAAMPTINLKPKLDEQQARKDVAVAETIVSPKEQVTSPKTDPKKSLKSPKRTEPEKPEPVTPKVDAKATTNTKTSRDSTTPTPRSSRASSAHTSVDLSETSSNVSDTSKTPVTTPKSTPKSGLKEPTKVDSTRKASAGTASPSQRYGTYSPSTSKKDTSTSPSPATVKKTTSTGTSSTASPSTINGTSSTTTSVASPSGLKRPSVLKKPSGGNLTGSTSSPSVNNSSVVAATSPEKELKASGSASTTGASGSPATSGLKKPSTVSGLKQPSTSSPSGGLKKFSSAKK